MPIKSGAPFEMVGVDCLGPVPCSMRKNKYVVLFSDYATHWIEGRALPSIEAPLIAEAFYELIITRHGCPLKLVSDQGSNFLSSLMKDVYKMMGTQKLNTTAYHPQTDGLVERLNQTLAHAITMYAHQNQKTWCQYLHSFLFAYRTSITTSMDEHPFRLLYGREPRLPMDAALLPPSSLSVKDSAHRSVLVKNIELAQKLALEFYNNSQEKMKRNYDKNAALYFLVKILMFIENNR